MNYIFVHTELQSHSSKKVNEIIKITSQFVMFNLDCLMLIPCCVSVRIQMVLVAPVRTSSSTNQIHVTHTEQKEERK